MASLPGKVQNAVKCAKELPHYYLWINSLLIIQGDNDYEGKQPGQMNRVYSYASINTSMRFSCQLQQRGPLQPIPRLPNP
jgi:hypothetical protein